MQIPFLDLTSLNKPYFSPFLRRTKEIFAQSDFINGAACKQFEQEFARYIGARYCLGVGNGTDALEIAIKALNLPKGSQIILPANTFKASCEAILNTGHKAVIVDCNEDYTINIPSLKRALTPGSAAILVVHLYGRICDMASILEIARSYELALIEDCSQAHGARIKIGNKMLFAGNIGDIATFSFYPSKNLGAIGDGGCILSNDKNLISRCQNIANHCPNPQEKIHFIGRNSRLDSLQAAFLSLKLPDLEAQNQHRQKIAKLYREKLCNIHALVLPQIPVFAHQCVWHLYVVRLQGELEGKREDLMEFLRERGIETRVHYAQNLTKLKEIHSNISTITSPTPNANNWEANLLSLPMGTHLQEKDIIIIAESIQAFCKLITKA
ncbi:DegT/DnrJ/EryC1/StrS family aminotransferase [Helicobacter mustelae]|uniref:Putative aminotransferase DegT/DnrJ/EryC1/StrS family n=1 Tax=Helicobacter mustelae (strain ATCC 43772 / CCUG 25715 / CIP 103759 / LMG 18044 / NCTC 12198 / R85-136P) TaxID=679897 RepID=D3UJE3_HELM1|nr:DegT/DnrJ/EryC1/StrS family aminotransferase [Helicobacter mustelae]CBG40619.1 putative aminotransferase DegT/DnrJ/EryC1/StrS family [Helicobacter mustelae 12198]SQH72117.1 DegT family aminotransferase [Helicobacter mustelae]STP13260.1 DegT family aminotransferase [Helicobacter mustelae]